jgi:hypothetical protein
MPDWGSIVYRRPRDSAADGGDGYSLGYSALAGPSLYHLEAGRSLRSGAQASKPMRVNYGRVGAVPLLHFAAAQLPRSLR